MVRLMGGAPGGTHRPGWPRHRRRPLLLLLPDAYAVTAKHGNFGALSCDTYCRSPAGGAQCTGGCSHAIDQATGWALTCDMVRGTTSDREVTCWCRGCLKGAGGAAAAARGRHALLEAAPPRPAELWHIFCAALRRHVQEGQRWRDIVRLLLPRLVGRVQLPLRLPDGV